MNKVILLGRLTKQPEVRTGTTGTAIVRYTLAVRRAYTQQGDVDYIPCVAFGSAATFAQQYLKKRANGSSDRAFTNNGLDR